MKKILVIGSLISLFSCSNSSPPEILKDEDKYYETAKYGTLDERSIRVFEIKDKATGERFIIANRGASVSIIQIK